MAPGNSKRHGYDMKRDNLYLLATFRACRTMRKLSIALTAETVVVAGMPIRTCWAFNIGGGPANTLSLLELISLLEEDLGITIPLKWSDRRPGDQPIFVCNLSNSNGNREIWIKC